MTASTADLSVFERQDYRRRYFIGSEPHNNTPYFIRRSTTPDEVLAYRNFAGGALRHPRRHAESLKNDALAIAFVKQHTSIPVPNIIATFEDRGCFYVIEEYIKDMIPAYKAPESAHPFIVEQLAAHMEELHSIKRDAFQSFTGRPFLPARLSNHDYLEHCEYPKTTDAYVLCHGDIGWHNVFVHPETFKIVSIIDWEWAGFYPVELEGQYWKRSGIACPKPDKEYSDANDLVNLLHSLALTKPEREPIEAVKADGYHELRDYEEQISMPHSTETSDQPAQIVRLPPMTKYTEQGLPISGSALVTQRFEDAKVKVAAALGEVANSMDEEVKAFRDWKSRAVRARLPRALGKGEVLSVATMFNEELGAKLPPLFQDLGTSMRAANLHLEPFAEHILKTSKFEASPEAETEEGKSKLAELKLDARREADDAIRQMEMEKWRAVKKFGHDIFLLAYAAEQHFPWYPTRYGSPAKRGEPAGEERKAVENRLRDLMEDGSGGWKVEVRDMTPEEYTAPKWKYNARVYD